MGLTKLRSMLVTALQWWEVGFLALVLGSCIHALTSSLPAAILCGVILYYLMMELRMQVRKSYGSSAAVALDTRFPLRTQLLLPNAQLVGATCSDDPAFSGGLVLDVVCGQGRERSFSLASGSVEEHDVGAWAGPVYLPGVGNGTHPSNIFALVGSWVNEGSPVDVALELQPGPEGTLRQTSVQIDNGAERLSLSVS